MAPPSDVQGRPRPTVEKAKRKYNEQRKEENGTDILSDLA